MLSDTVIPPKSSADLIALNYKGDLGLNAMQMFNPPSRPALKLLPFLQHVCIQQAPPQAPLHAPTREEPLDRQKKNKYWNATSKNPY